MGDTEVAVFNQNAKQDRHYHNEGTEIYMVLEGKMETEVAGQNYLLVVGDMIVVNPGAVHEVKRNTNFICPVITVNCEGLSDKVQA